MHVMQCVGGRPAPLPQLENYLHLKQADKNLEGQKQPQDNVKQCKIDHVKNIVFLLSKINLI